MVRRRIRDEARGARWENVVSIDRDEEVRQFWADVDECVRIVESWPQWKRDACRAILSPASVDQWDDECSDVGYTYPG